MTATKVIGKERTRFNLQRTWPLYCMLLGPVVITILFSYVPMYGVVIGFQDYNPGKGFIGSPWVGLKWFKYLFSLEDFGSLMFNTMYIACGKIIIGLLLPIVFAILLSELQSDRYKKIIQTFTYLPNFLSWVIIGGIFIEFLSGDGILNRLIKWLGFEPVYFLGSNKTFRWTMILLEGWKGFGWGCILYLAAIAGIDPSLYESAIVDGASRFKQVLHITLPGMSSIIILNMTLSLGGVLNAGFDQLFMFLNPVVYETGDIIDTFVYRVGLQRAEFSLSTAIGLFKSGISMVLTITAYSLAYKFSDYRLF